MDTLASIAQSTHKIYKTLVRCSVENKDTVVIGHIYKENLNLYKSVMQNLHNNGGVWPCIDWYTILANDSLQNLTVFHYNT